MGIKSGYLRTVNSLRHLFQGRLEHWQDPQVVYQNTVEHHTPLRLLSTKDQAFESVSKDRGETDWVLFIAHREQPKQCQFKLFPNPASCNWAQVTVADNNADAFNQWDTQEIPSNWQLQYPHQDPPIYTNITFPWERFMPLTTSVPKHDNPTGCYRIAFDLPANWVQAVESSERELFLILHGAGPGVDIFVNGQHVGYGQDSMTETEVNLSSLPLKEKDNNLTLIVYRWTDGSYMEDQDQWWLSGVFRDVELSCRPASAGIVDYIVETTYKTAAEGKHHGTVTVHVKTNDSEESLAQNSTMIRGSLFDKSKKPVANVESGVSRSRTFARETAPKNGNDFSVATLTFEIEDVHLWNVNDPYLYTLTLESVRADGNVVQVEATRVGVRVVEIKRAQVHVNGEPILVCGVNRHEWELETGKVIHERSMLHDIKLLKQFNFNAVRNCHYPNNHRWYELCDEYGLFIIDEANIETHGFAKVAHISLLQCDWKWKKAFLTRVQACVRRSRNHACIIGWSLGNESGSGDNSRACAAWVRKVDPTRTLQYEGGIQSGDSPMLMGDGCDPVCTDIICPMYDSPLLMAQIEKRTNAKTGPYRARPLILCEYAHAMGNSSGNLHIYWKLFRSKEHPKMQGGFIWDMVDQSLSIPEINDGNWGYGGDFGPKSGKEDKTFCINGMCFGDRTPHPAMHEAKYLQQPLTFSFDFSSQALQPSYSVGFEMFPHAPFLDQLSFHYLLFSATSADPVDRGVCTVVSFDKVTKAGTLTLEEAGTKSRAVSNKFGCVYMLLQASLSDAMPYAPKAHLVAQERFELDEGYFSKIRPSYSNIGTSPSAEKVTVSRATDEAVFTVSSDSYTALFDMKTGRLLSLGTAANEPVIETDGVKHCFFRAPTDNDLGGLDTMLPNELLKPFVNRTQTAFISQWRKLGLDSLTAKTTKVHMDTVEDGGMESFQLEVHETHSSNGAARFKTVVKYVCTPAGVLMDVQVRATASTLSGTFSLPRIGTELVLSSDMAQVEYLGCGPHESYPDRKASAWMGVHKTSVDDMHVKYAMPSECGGRADVQWATFHSTESRKKALKVTYMFPEEDLIRPEFFDGMDLSKKEPSADVRPSDMKGAQLNASRYSIEELDLAKHQWELPAKGPNSPVYVHIDTAHMGLGGDVSWMPKTHQQYRVHGKEWKYKLHLQIN